MVKITEDMLKAAMPSIKDGVEWADLMNKILPLYGIDTTKRIAMFVAQCGHESMDFNVRVENLNYGATGLLKTFKKYFNIATAAIYARKPEKIANRVYANRMGNGDEKSGDGWKYRGKGLIQLTGKQNHLNFATDTGISIDSAVTYLLTKEGALRSACWFWKEHSINALADRGNVLSATKIINGGTNGLVDRTSRYQKALKAFK